MEKLVLGRPPGSACKVVAFQFLGQMKYRIFAEKLQFYWKQDSVIQVQMCTMELVSGSIACRSNSREAASSTVPDT